MGIRIDAIRKDYPITLGYKTLHCPKCNKQHDFLIVAKDVHIVKENFIDDISLEFSFNEAIACCEETDSAFNRISENGEYDYLAAINSEAYRKAQLAELDKLASEHTIYYIFRHYHHANSSAMTHHKQVGLTMDKNKIFDIIKADEASYIKEKEEEVNAYNERESSLILSGSLSKPRIERYTYSVSIGVIKETPGLEY